VTETTPASDERGSLWRRLTRGVRKLKQAPDWQEFAGVGWPDCIMQVEVTDRLFRKQGRSIARWTLTIADDRRLVVYLKRHYRLAWWRGILATFLPRRNWSPGMQEWEHLNWAAAQGLPVPRAVAAGEFIGPWCRLQSFIAIEELDGMLALHEAIPLAQTNLDSSDFRAWKRSLVAEMARLAKALHRRRWFHKDLYLCHFYVSESDTRCVPESWQERVVVIDLHRLAQHPWTAPWWKVKDLAQLLYSSEIPGITARDRLGFWRAYGAGQGILHRFLGWCVRLKWRLYRRHNSANDTKHSS
jgi:Lipopolysaccharide kinase (Kdo/WaaP) family